jgi:hypothetical protein
MLKSNGTFAWLRRFNQDTNLRTFKDGLITSDGRLLLVAEGDFSSMLSLVSVERDGASLARERAACLCEVSPDTAVLVRRLHQMGVHVVSPNASPVDPSNEPPQTLRNGCPLVTEPQFEHFMRALASALPPPTSNRPELPQVAIRLLESGEAPRLESYGLGVGGFSGRLVYSGFAVPHDYAQDFARFLVEILGAHARRMSELQEEFARLTYIVYGAHIETTTDFQHALANLEAAATSLNERVKAAPPDKVLYIRETRPNDCVGATLTPDGFGTGYVDDPYKNRPLSQALETLLHIVELRRKSTAAGDMCTIG